MKNFFANFALFLGALGFIFIAGEALSRLFQAAPMRVVKNFSPVKPAANGENSKLFGHGDPDSLYQYSLNGAVRLTPNANIVVQNHYLSHLDIEISTNSLGFRAPELSEKTGGERRVLVLGDSITLGDYVSEPQTYPSRIEAHLRTRGRNYRVVNAGIGSADIHNEYEILAESGLRADPDIVLVGLYLNDGELSANLVIPPLPGVLAQSYFASYLNRKIRLMVYRWRNREELAGSGRAWVEKFVAGRKLNEKNWEQSQEGFDYLIVKNARDWGAGWDPNTWKTIESYLGKMQTLAEQHGFKLAVVLFPVRHQVEAQYLYDAPQQYFRNLMAKLGLAHQDLLPVLRSALSRAPGQTLYFDKCHLTPEGNDIVGRSIAEFLLEQNLPERPRIGILETFSPPL
jgi:GDSL-like Lipase/Acylhydrolase.